MMSVGQPWALSWGSPGRPTCHDSRLELGVFHRRRVVYRDRLVIVSQPSESQDIRWQELLDIDWLGGCLASNSISLFLYGLL